MDTGKSKQWHNATQFFFQLELVFHCLTVVCGFAGGLWVSREHPSDAAKTVEQREGGRETGSGCNIHTTPHDDDDDAHHFLILGIRSLASSEAALAFACK